MIKKFDVWYMRPEFFREGTLGALPVYGALSATHVKVKTLELPGSAAQLEHVFHDMQAEVWSPNGEARALIESLGLSHTSMSVGDAVVVDGQLFVVSNIGFKQIEHPARERRVQ